MQSEEWAFEHAIECRVSREFAWNFWTNVQNWLLDADVESVELHGAFATGARGVTISKKSGRVEWLVAEAMPPERAVLEFSAPGAVARFTWIFDGVKGRTLVTQRVNLSGEQAAMYGATIGSELQVGIPDGMQRLCQAMETAFRPHAK